MHGKGGLKWRYLREPGVTDAILAQYWCAYFSKCTMLILLAHRRYQYHYQIPFLDLVWDFKALERVAT
jgi:hypothetical protein